MSAQTVSLSLSLPQFAAQWEGVGMNPKGYDFLIVRSLVNPKEVTIKDIRFMVNKEGERIKHPSVTAALRDSEAILKARGFTSKGKLASGSPTRDESKHWGVWAFLCNVRDGKIVPSLEGDTVAYQFILPVVRPIAGTQTAPQAEVIVTEPKKPLALPPAPVASLAENAPSADNSEIIEVQSIPLSEVPQSGTEEVQKPLRKRSRK